MRAVGSKAAFGSTRRSLGSALGISPFGRPKSGAYSGSPYARAQQVSQVLFSSDTSPSKYELGHRRFVQSRVKELAVGDSSAFAELIAFGMLGTCGAKLTEYALKNPLVKHLILELARHKFFLEVVESIVTVTPEQVKNMDGSLEQMISMPIESERFTAEQLKEYYNQIFKLLNEFKKDGGSGEMVYSMRIPPTKEDVSYYNALGILYNHVFKVVKDLGLKTIYDFEGAEKQALALELSQLVETTHPGMFGVTIRGIDSSAIDDLNKALSGGMRLIKIVAGVKGFYDHGKGELNSKKETFQNLQEMIEILSSDKGNGVTVYVGSHNVPFIDRVRNVNEKNSHGATFINAVLHPSQIGLIQHLGTSTGVAVYYLVQMPCISLDKIIEAGKCR